VTPGLSGIPPSSGNRTDGESFRIGVWREVLGSYQASYDDVRDTWKNLDAKAQATVAIAGILIAGIVSLVKDISPATGTIDVFLAVSAAVNAVGAVLIAAVALRIRQTSAPPAGQETEEDAEIALGTLTSGNIHDVEQAFVQQQIIGWRRAVETVHSGNEDKADLLIFSQRLLLGSLCLLLFLVVRRAVYAQ
jgi:hypothetical protein